MRNKNIESMRGIAILLLLFYHYTVSLSVFQSMNLIMLDEAFCQSAMLIFFMISGYGTFLHYQRREANGEQIHWLDYVKSRFGKIAPAYYASLLFILLFTTGGAYLSRGGLKSILSYGTFTQNLFPWMSGDINGVTWTLALLMQFYLISYLVYRIVKKMKWTAYPLFLFFSMIINKFLCGIVTAHGYPEVYYVIVSIREIFTTIDIFVLGMLCGSLADKHLFAAVKKEVAVLGALLTFGVAVILFIKGSYIVGGIWGDGFRFFLWKPLMSIVIGFIMLLLAPCQISYGNWIGKGIQFVAKVEYNTYLWHMILFGNLKNTSALFNEVAQRTPMGAAVGMMVLAVMVGYVSTRLIAKRKIAG